VNDGGNMHTYMNGNMLTKIHGVRQKRKKKSNCTNRIGPTKLHLIEGIATETRSQAMVSPQACLLELSTVNLSREQNVDVVAIFVVARVSGWRLQRAISARSRPQLLNSRSPTNHST